LAPLESALLLQKIHEQIRISGPTKKSYHQQKSAYFFTGKTKKTAEKLKE
jgi:hypothetical protein